MSERISNIMYQFSQQMKKIFRITLVTFMLLVCLDVRRKNRQRLRSMRKLIFWKNRKSEKTKQP